MKVRTSRNTLQKKYDALGELNLAVGPDVLEVLVAEDDDLALRDEQREFVAAL